MTKKLFIEALIKFFLGVILVALVAAISIHLSNVYSNGRNEDETFKDYLHEVYVVMLEAIEF